MKIERGAYRQTCGRKPRRSDNLLWNMGAAIDKGMAEAAARKAEAEENKSKALADGGVSGGEKTSAAEEN